VSELTPYPRTASEREEAEGPPTPAAGYASWGRRAGALIIDNILLIIPAVGFFALVFVPNETVAAIAAFLAIFFWLVFPFIYFTYLHGKTGQTLGKRWLGIRVEHADRGGPIGYGAAFGRYGMVFVFSIFTFPLVLDYLFPLWDSKKQSLHDKVVSSIVVRA
jgi:uncharacterized RDD family membrane protein YckC